MAAARQRQSRKPRRQGSEAVEEIVVLTEHDRGPHHRGAGHGRAGGRFALGLGAGVLGSRGRVGADRRHLDQSPDAARPRRLGDVARPLGVQAGEALTTVLEQHAHQVDAGVSPLQRPLHRRRDPDIGLGDLDLADLAEQGRAIGQVGAPAGDADAIAALGQSPGHLHAQEPRAAENRDQSLHRPAFRLRASIDEPRARCNEGAGRP